MKGTSTAGQATEGTQSPDKTKITQPSSSSSFSDPSRGASATTYPARVSGGSRKLAPGGGSVRGGERAGMLGVDAGEKRGVLHNSIPCMPLPLAVLCCLLNIVIPGMGTFISAWTALCGCRTRVRSPVRALGWGLLAALGQMLSFVFILGWVWSILWGMNFVHIAMSAGETQKLPYYVRRQSSVE